MGDEGDRTVPTSPITDQWVPRAVPVRDPDFTVPGTGGIFLDSDLTADTVPMARTDVGDRPDRRQRRDRAQPGDSAGAVRIGRLADAARASAQLRRGDGVARLRRSGRAPAPEHRCAPSPLSPRSSRRWSSCSARSARSASCSTTTASPRPTATRSPGWRITSRSSAPRASSPPTAA